MSRLGFPDRRALIACLLCAGIARLLGTAIPTTSGLVSQRTLTFAERVAYQYGIEEVYWRHRIWPKENPGQKPPLDKVMSQAQIEKKVEDYLRNSQALEDYWQRPITPEQLQAEMDRMATHTKQPGVLREIFAALGNDPFVIAECLARPLLAERMAAERIGGSSAPSLDDKFNREAIANSWPSAPGNIARGAADPPDVAYTLPEISAPLDCADDTWTPTSVISAPDGRQFHTAVWTGTEMIVWGGNTSAGYFNTGGRYNPATDTWIATSTINAPAARWDHTAVWTGSEMIVWGGSGNGPYLDTGGRYNPGTDSWTATSTTNAPPSRILHTAVWTGSEMIVWGGADGNDTGGRYSPTTDTWTATSTTNAPEPRYHHTAVWTGSEMIVWGGQGINNVLNNGGKYNPGIDSWTATSTPSAPTARFAHTAVWTGSEMIVWGGYNNGIDWNSGGRYNPGTNTWTATDITNAPAGREYHTAVWTGSEMIVWGGYFYSGGGAQYQNTGGRYNPGIDSWTATSTTNVPPGRTYHTALWTGSEMIVWGGYGGGVVFLNSGGKYCAQPSTPIVQSTVSRKSHGGAGSFDVDLPLTGTPGTECRSGGATSDYTIVVTFLANVSVNGNPQAAVTMGTATIGNGGVSNGGTVIIAGNVVTIPLTNVTNAQTINLTLNNVNGSTNVTIPMRVLIGDVNGNGTVNASDVALTKSRIGQPVDPTTFRSDVNANGSVNATDLSLVKSSIGTGLP